MGLYASDMPFFRKWPAGGLVEADLLSQEEFDCRRDR